MPGFRQLGGKSATAGPRHLVPDSSTSRITTSGDQGRLSTAPVAAQVPKTHQGEITTFYADFIYIIRVGLNITPACHK